MRKNVQPPGFGARLSALRKAAGYTQQELDVLIEREQLRATRS